MVQVDSPCSISIIAPYPVYSLNIYLMVYLALKDSGIRALCYKWVLLQISTKQGYFAPKTIKNVYMYNELAYSIEKYFWSISVCLLLYTTVQKTVPLHEVQPDARFQQNSFNPYELHWRTVKVIKMIHFLS